MKGAVRNKRQSSKSGNYVEMRKTEKNRNSSTFNINSLRSGPKIFSGITCDKHKNEYENFL